MLLCGENSREHEDTQPCPSSPSAESRRETRKAGHFINPQSRRKLLAQGAKNGSARSFKRKRKELKMEAQGVLNGSASIFKCLRFHFSTALQWPQTPFLPMSGDILIKMCKGKVKSASIRLIRVVRVPISFITTRQRINSASGYHIIFFRTSC